MKRTLATLHTSVAPATALLLFVLSGCHEQETLQASPPQASTPQASSPQASQPQASSPQAVSSQASEAIRDLADRLGVPSGAITLVREEMVTWPDGSLGCPKPGVMYTQALVEGSRIVLRAGGTEYGYHAGRRQAPVYCNTPVRPLPNSSRE